MVRFTINVRKRPKRGCSSGEVVEVTSHRQKPIREMTEEELNKELEFITQRKLDVMNELINRQKKYRKRKGR